MSWAKDTRMIIAVLPLWISLSGEHLMKALSNSKFFSLQADGSTDAGNNEEELFLVLHFDPYFKDGKVHIRDSFFTVRHLRLVVELAKVCLDVWRKQQSIWEHVTEDKAHRLWL